MRSERQGRTGNVQPVCYLEHTLDVAGTGTRRLGHLATIRKEIVERRITEWSIPDGGCQRRVVGEEIEIGELVAKSETCGINCAVATGIEHGGLQSRFHRMRD